MGNSYRVPGIPALILSCNTLVQITLDVAHKTPTAGQYVGCHFSCISHYLPFQEVRVKASSPLCLK